MRAGEPGTEGAAFLVTDANARAAAMGGAATASVGGTGWLYYNPAGLATLDRHEMSAAHIEAFGGENYEILGYARPWGAKAGIGVSVEYVHSEDFVRTEGENLATFVNSDLAVALSGAYRIHPRVSLGVTGKFIQERLFTFQANAQALDIGVLMNPRDNLTLGASVLNLGTKIRFIRDEDPLPVRYRFAAAYRLKRLLGAYDLIATNGADPTHALGLEYTLTDDLFLRGGYRMNYNGRGADGPTAGFGARLLGLELRYAYTPQTTEISDHRIEAAFGWGGRGPSERAPRAEPRRPGERRRLRLPLDMTGSATWALRHTSINNGKVLGRPPGFSSLLDWTFLGSGDGFDYTFSGQAAYDQWDATELRRGTLLFRAPRVEATIGDLLAEMTPYTISPQTIRGGRVLMDRPVAAPPAALAPDAEAVREGGASVGRWYRRSARDSRFFRGTQITALAGRSERPLNVGSRIRLQNGRLASIGTFERFVYGLSMRETLEEGEFGLHVAQAGDDAASISLPGSAKPLRSSTISFTARKIFPNGRTILDVEHAYSRSYRDRRSETTKNNDIASFARFRSAGRDPYKTWEVAFERIGANYEAVASPITRSQQDRLGPRGRASHPIGKIGTTLVVGRANGETRRDNLDHRDPFTTRVSIGGGGLDFIFAGGQRLTLGGSIERDLSGNARDTSNSIARLDRRTTDRRLFVSILCGNLTAQAGFGRTRLGDRTRYNTGSQSSFTLTSLRAGLFGVIGRAQISGNWIHSTSFFRASGSTSKQDFLFGRVGYDWIPGKLTSAATAQYTVSRSPTQEEIRYDIGGQVQYNLSTERAIGLEVHRFADQFAPSIPTLDHDGTEGTFRWTQIF